MENSLNNSPQPSGLRLVAAVLAAVTGATLALRIGLRMHDGETFFQATSYLSQFFTILTNVLVLLTATAAAFGQAISVRWVRALTISILAVGLIYHALLAHLVDFTGWGLVADHGVHTVVPALTALWWLFWIEKPRISFSDIGLWVAWPLAYCAYILFRASFSGFYPYPFLDLPTHGPAGLALNILGLLVAFIAIGLVLVMAGKLTSLLLPAKEPAAP